MHELWYEYVCVKICLYLLMDMYIHIYIHLHPKFEEHFGKCVFQKKHRTAKSDTFGLFHPKALKGLKG